MVAVVVIRMVRGTPFTTHMATAMSPAACMGIEPIISADCFTTPV